MERTDVVVVGGGIVGLATARALLQARPDLGLVVLEKEPGPAVHQSGRNSGVIHSGVYYRAGSLKARTVAAGRTALLQLCNEHAIPYQIIGKVIVATADEERYRLHELQRRAQESGVPSELLGPERLAELEPHATGVEALHVPGAGIVDYGEVCRTLVRLLRLSGGEFRPSSRVLRVEERDRGVVVGTERGEVEARAVVNCAGLHSDTLAATGPGDTSPLRIVPFRGEYHRLTGERSDLVRTMIYPVPDPRFPFLGAHFTRGTGGEVHAGPNAVLALAREGYTWRIVDPAEVWDLLRFSGFRRLAARYWRTGAGEVWRSLSKGAFVRGLQRLVPEIGACDLTSMAAGVRAQAVDAAGNLVEDFVVRESARMVHVLNAPSPAATASLEIGRLVAARALEKLAISSSRPTPGGSPAAP